MPNLLQFVQWLIIMLSPQIVLYLLAGNNVFYIIGAILAASGVPSLLYVGRLITGLGVGVTSVVAPVLLSEIASEATRGVVTTNHQVLRIHA